MKIRAAVVQTLAALGEIQENIGLLRQYTQEAVRQGADLVVFPECMNTGYLFDSADHCRTLAEPLTGPFVAAMADLCRHYGIHIASGITELDPESGKVYNSGVLLNAQGEIAIHYQKQFLATHDQNWFEVGVKGSPVADTDLGRMGLLICFDGRIPEIARCLALQGAEIIVDMANFFTLDQADLWGPARAYENGIWLVAATKSGVERSIYYPGGSMIVAPNGQVLVRIPNDTHAVASADIETTAAQDKRWWGKGEKLADRQPLAYSILTQPFAETPVAKILPDSLVPEASTVKIAAVQSHATEAVDSWKATLAQLTHAAKLGIQLLVLPEHCTHFTWMLNPEQAEVQADQAPQYLDQVAEIARQYGCSVVLPLVQRVAGQLMSTAVLVGATGEVLGEYHQVHLSPEARIWGNPGDQLPVFDTPLGRIGMILGYDGLFPESTRVLALQGADIITWSCAWRERVERGLLAVPKAEDNRVYVVCANRWDCPYPGGSFVVPPQGFPHWDVNIVAPPTQIRGAVMPMYANLALSRQKRIIPQVDVLRNRLVSTYQPLVTQS
ncbi:MAG: carbon-nitrogen hydrolase family protein [Synechococcaceae cyanobacterium SM2_3_1]|nr:carbon-nitrogen hydrolase family protein [Synechococcaceae cyanobacterium SM2_3_1]